jgi:hypothetical protein
MDLYRFVENPPVVGISVKIPLKDKIKNHAEDCDIVIKYDITHKIKAIKMKFPAFPDSLVASGQILFQEFCPEFWTFVRVWRQRFRLKEGMQEKEEWDATY